MAFVLGGLLGALFIGDFLHQYEKKVLENGIEETKPLVIQGELLPESAPVILSIPKLNLEAPFTAPLGLETNGEVEVPDGYEEVGWYQYSPTPGELGPSIILGHVDSVDGPAIFWSLGELEPGDTVDIEREDGSVATFEITELARYEQAGFPTQLVYGDIDHAGLRLITCSGTFDKGEQRYSHNLVVYGRLITET
ncbi:MAG: class F sortase [Patescibacteria group bacterium]